MWLLWRLNILRGNYSLDKYSAFPWTLFIEHRCASSCAVSRAWSRWLRTKEMLIRRDQFDLKVLPAWWHLWCRCGVTTQQGHVSHQEEITLFENDDELHKLQPLNFAHEQQPGRNAFHITEKLQDISFYNGSTKCKVCWGLKYIKTPMQTLQKFIFVNHNDSGGSFSLSPSSLEFDMWFRVIQSGRENHSRPKQQQQQKKHPFL